MMTTMTMMMTAMTIEKKEPMGSFELVDKRRIFQFDE